MDRSATRLWPDLLGTQAQIEFWLDSPEVPAAKAAATRHKLTQPLLHGEVQKVWVRLYAHLCTARATGPHPATAEVATFCQLIAATGQVDREETSTIKHRLLTGTQREFEWHQRHLWAACLASAEAEMQLEHQH